MRLLSRRDFSYFTERSCGIEKGEPVSLTIVHDAHCYFDRILRQLRGQGTKKLPFYSIGLLKGGFVSCSLVVDSNLLGYEDDSRGDSEIPQKQSFCKLS